MPQDSQKLRICGYILMAASAVLTFAFGLTWAKGTLEVLFLPAGLVCASIASALIWPRIYNQWRNGDKHGVAWLMIFGVLFTSADLVSNFGTLSYQRGSDIKAAKVQDVVYSETNNAVADAKRDLKMAQEQLSTLLTAKSWAATANATQMRANLEFAKQKAIEESQRGGCGRLCRGWERRAAEIAAKLPAVEAKQSYDDRIAAAQRVLAKRRAEAKATPPSYSAASMQNLSLASFFTMSLKPDQASQHWTNKGISWLLAALFSFGAMGCFLAAQHGAWLKSQPKEPTPSAPISSLTVDAKPKSDDTLSRLIEIKDDRQLWQVLNSVINGNTSTATA